MGDVDAEKSGVAEKIKRKTGNRNTVELCRTRPFFRLPGWGLLSVVIGATVAVVVTMLAAETQTDGHLVASTPRRKGNVARFWSWSWTPNYRS